MMLRIYFSALVLLSVSWTHAQSACRWKVKGRVVWANSTKSMAGWSLRVSAREKKKGKKWSSLRWPNPKTDARGAFEGRSGIIATTCKRARDLKLEVKYGGEWVKVAIKHNVKGKKKGRTVDFGTVKVYKANLIARAGCRHVDVDLFLTAGGKPLGEGVQVAMTESKPSRAALKTWNLKDVKLATKTKSNSRIQGFYGDCSRAGKGKKPLRAFISFRSDFHGDTNRITIPANGRLTGSTIPFKGPYLKPFGPPTIKFALPLLDASKFHRRHSLTSAAQSVPMPDILSSVFVGLVKKVYNTPKNMDHDIRSTEYDGVTGGYAYSFDGKKAFASVSYPGHMGTDFMLKGYFAQMDREPNYVVTAADGHIVAYVDGHYDRCTFNSGKERHVLTVDMNDKSNNRTQTKPRCTKNSGNYVIVEHRDRNGVNLRTKYVHFKAGSVIAALRKLGLPQSDVKWRKHVRLQNPIWTRCRTILGEIGSSGRSMGPHLHFEVERRYPGKKKWIDVDPYQGKLSHWGYWVRQNGPNQLPGSKCQSPGDK
ncbi:MAG: M23 family metallopeptidase [Myxococcota bacterium]|nr:M23 family metallopeptidase [Myxococcota bacterium]